MGVEPWALQRIPNIADARSAFLTRQEQRRMQPSTVDSVGREIFVGASPSTLFEPDRPTDLVGYRKFQLCGWLNHANCATMATLFATRKSCRRTRDQHPEVPI
jgi:hypothetical protein